MKHCTYREDSSFAKNQWLLLNHVRDSILHDLNWLLSGSKPMSFVPLLFLSSLSPSRIPNDLFPCSGPKDVFAVFSPCTLFSGCRRCQTHEHFEPLSFASQSRNNHSESSGIFPCGSPASSMFAFCLIFYIQSAWCTWCGLQSYFLRGKKIEIQWYTIFHAPEADRREKITRSFSEWNRDLCHSVGERGFRVELRNVMLRKLEFD